MDTFSHIANYLSGSCSPEEAARLEAWRKASAANEVEFSKMKKVWEAAAPPSFCPDASLAWQKVQARICAKDKDVPVVKMEARHPAGRHWLKSGWSIAAAFALLLLSLGGYVLLQKQDTFIPAGLTSAETSAREKQHIVLADGTEVWLNQHSSLSYPEQFKPESRDVYLKGEAFFEVAHQPDKPFTVHTRNSRVQVVGTSFNLQESKGAPTRLQVRSGKVKFSSSKAAGAQASLPSLFVSAGEAALLVEDNPQMEPLPANYLAWQSGAFEFTDTPLEEVFHLLEQYYSVNIQAVGLSLLSCRLNARFEKQSLEEVLKVIGLSFQLRYEQKDGQVIFYGNGSSCTSEPAI